MFVSTQDSVSQLVLVRDATMPSTTVGANTVAVQHLDVPPVEGYDPIGIVGANSWHGQAVYQGFDLSESTVMITLRNVSGSSITTSGSVSILYMKRLV